MILQEIVFQNFCKTPTFVFSESVSDGENHHHHLSKFQRMFSGIFKAFKDKISPKRDTKLLENCKTFSNQNKKGQSNNL